MTQMQKLNQMKLDALELQSQNSHLSRSLDGVIDFLNDAIDDQHEHDGTGKYAPTEEEIKEHGILQRAVWRSDD